MVRPSFRALSTKVELTVSQVLVLKCARYKFVFYFFQNSERVSKKSGPAIVIPVKHKFSGDIIIIINFKRGKHLSKIFP